jgi:hypothetical protein
MMLPPPVKEPDVYWRGCGKGCSKKRTPLIPACLIRSLIFAVKEVAFGDMRGPVTGIPKVLVFEKRTIRCKIN